MQLLLMYSEKAGRMALVLGGLTAHMDDLDEVFGSWFWPGLALTVDHLREWTSGWKISLCVFFSPPVTLPFQINNFLKTYFIFIRKLDIQRRGQRRNLPSADSHPKRLQQLELSQSEAMSQDLLPGLPHGCRVPRLWAVLDCFPRPQAGSWMGSGTIKRAGIKEI